MDHMTITEENNKRWLKLLKQWDDKFKENIFNSSADAATSLVNEIHKHYPWLQRYLFQIKKLLSEKGVECTLKDLPTVGKLLSQMCKLPIVMLNDGLNDTVISCMIMLSKLLSDKGKAEINKTASNWALTHFSVLTSFFNEGVDMFLMEEMGVSQEEYMQEHLNQCLIELVSSLESCENKNVSLDQSLIQLLLLVIEISDIEQLLPLIGEVLRILYGQPANNNNRLTCLDTLLKRKKIHTFPIEIISDYFSLHYPAFEDMVLTIIEKISENYNIMNKKEINKLLVSKNLDKLFKHNIKFYYATIDILRKFITVLQPHPAAMLILESFNEIISCIGSGSIQVKPHMKQLYGLLHVETKCMSVTAKGMHIAEIINACNQCLNDHPMKRSCVLDLWMSLSTVIHWFNHSMTSLFDVSKQVLQPCLELCLLVMYPMTRQQWLPYVPTLSSHILTLRQLTTKKHIQPSDLQYIFSSIERKLNNCPIDSTMLIIKIIFFTKTCSGGELTNQYLEKIVTRESRDDILLFWFFYTLDILHRRCSTIPTTFSLQIVTLIKTLQQKYRSDILFIKRCHTIIHDYSKNVT